MARSSALCCWLPSCLIVCAISLPAFAETRVALVIGNSAYQNVAQLANAVNDAKLLAETLRGLGFTLVGGGPRLDLDQRSLDLVVQDFGRQLRSPKADIGVFYYAGYAVQLRGANYLVPVDASPKRVADFAFWTLDVNKVVLQMASASEINVLLLDASHNNPFGAPNLAVARGRDTDPIRLSDLPGGLAQMQAPAGTLISFPSQPGSVAQDGPDGHSPYAKTLAATLPERGQSLLNLFINVGVGVRLATGNAQNPWLATSVARPFYLVRP